MAENVSDDNDHIYLNPKNWLKELELTKVHDHDLNRVIMNFFCVHRMYDVAEEFSKEARVKPDMPINAMKIRHIIRSEISKNNIENAIMHIKNLDYGILKNHKDIIFYLKKQQLLNLILSNNVDEAITYSQTELAPLVNEKPSLISEIDDVMMLLAYQDFTSEEAKSLINKIDAKHNTLKRIDDIILNYYNIDNESTLEHIVKNVFFTQDLLSTKYPCTIPHLKCVQNSYIEYTNKPKKKKKKHLKRENKSKKKDSKNKNDKISENPTNPSNPNNPIDPVKTEDEYRSI